MPSSSKQIGVQALMLQIGVALTFLLVCWLFSFNLPWVAVIAILTAGLYWTLFTEHVHSLDDEAKSGNVFVIIIGAGYSGLCMAIKLKQANIPFLVLEKSANLGGTWWDNQYPGCACDIMSHLYSFSFFPNPFWKSNYPSQPEILKYLEKVANHYDVQKNIQFDTRVDSCKFNEEASTWEVKTSTGECFSCNFLVSGIGALHVPKMPNIPGIDNFHGEAFHTALWNKGCDLSNKAVGIIGTGASAVQVVPSILDAVKSIHVFQRTPTWTAQKPDFKFPTYVQTIFYTFPFIMKLFRWFIFFRQEYVFVILFGKNSWLSKKVRGRLVKGMQDQINDPVLKEELIPKYDPGCKRMVISNDYLTSFNSPKTTLVTKPIKSITEKGILIEDNDEDKEISCDVIIYATGFDVLASNINVREVLGKNSENLTKYWGNTPNAYLGIVSPKFPNYYILLGPNTGLGHNSVVWMIECQVNYIMDAIVKATNQGIRYLEVKEEVNAKYQDHMKYLMKFRVFYSGCKSWYQNSEGFVFSLWPSHLVHYWWVTKCIDFSDYNIKY